MSSIEDIANGLLSVDGLISGCTARLLAEYKAVSGIMNTAGAFGGKGGGAQLTASLSSALESISAAKASLCSAEQKLRACVSYIKK